VKRPLFRNLFTTSLPLIGDGVSANLMSLGAIDFGMIVDSSVVIIENCVHRLESRSFLERTELCHVCEDSRLRVSR
jgi:cobalt-zinc-cadmium resistance protein CzcA